MKRRYMKQQWTLRFKNLGLIEDGVIRSMTPLADSLPRCTIEVVDSIERARLALDQAEQLLEGKPVPRARCADHDG